MIKSNPGVFFAASFEISFDTSSVVVRAISSFSMELFNGNIVFADVSFRVNVVAKCSEYISAFSKLAFVHLFVGVQEVLFVQWIC